MIVTIIILPTDVLVIIFELLSIPTLAGLSQTCKYLHFAVSATHMPTQRQKPSQSYNRLISSAGRHIYS